MKASSCASTSEEPRTSNGVPVNEMYRVSNALAWMILIPAAIAIVLCFIGNYQLIQRMETESYEVISMETRRFMLDEYGEVLVRFQDGSIHSVTVGLDTFADIALQQN